jgi:hypothetical protein
VVVRVEPTVVLLIESLAVMRAVVWIIGAVAAHADIKWLHVHFLLGRRTTTPYVPSVLVRSDKDFLDLH